MYRLPNPPSGEAEKHELADFAELLCWHKGTVSKREIVAHLNRLDDNDNNEGCDDDEDENSAFLDEVMNEIDRRRVACGDGYPFKLDGTGTILKYHAGENDRRKLYLYLLLSTRLNMRDRRTHAGIDGTALLEEVSAHALQNYLGGATRARSHVFGTSVEGKFQDKIDRLCQELQEGGCFRALDEDAEVHAQDDKLDAIAWVPFSDELPGQTIIFGQSKTGSSWGPLVTQLQPESFIRKWMDRPFLVTPLRAFCLSEAVDRSRWKGLCCDAGIVLDRCRLVDFCDNITTDLINRIDRWTTAAKDTINFATH